MCVCLYFFRLLVSSFCLSSVRHVCLYAVRSFFLHVVRYVARYVFLAFVRSLVL